MSKESGFRRLTPLRVAATAIVSAGLLVPLAVFGGTGFAQTGSPAQVQYKITICHHTHSTTNPTVTIRISSAAWKAHLKHHDTMGPCPPKPLSSPPTTPTTTSQASVSSSDSSSSPGKSGDSHGNSSNSSSSPGKSDESHGNSSNAPGHNK